MESPYQSKDGKPKLVRSVAAFVDFLGYSEYIRKSFAEGKAQQELERLRSAIDIAYFDLKQMASRSEYGSAKLHVRTFTDNLIIGLPVGEHGYARDQVCTVVFYIACLQAELARHGYFIRGAISVGDLYIDEDVVFGPALMEAYAAESKEAVFPRVILCKSAEETFSEPDWVRAISLLVDSDNRVFVDFLDATVMIAYPDDRPFTEYSEGHREAIIQKLAEFREAPYIRAKYEWAATYHNAFCEKNANVPDMTAKIPLEMLLPAPKPWMPATPS